MQLPFLCLSRRCKLRKTNKNKSRRHTFAHKFLEDEQIACGFRCAAAAIAPESHHVMSRSPHPSHARLGCESHHQPIPSRQFQWRPAMNHQEPNTQWSLSPPFKFRRISTPLSSPCASQRRQQTQIMKFQSAAAAQTPFPRRLLVFQTRFVRSHTGAQLEFLISSERRWHAGQIPIAQLRVRAR
jgi:hypothetical protein